ncbi:cilia- and flagella-associated protein 73 isoform X2 [Phalacrocorax aristotelis]|uniref:cilia- and flagella-associated protein 73 isoform X2 n=1 Tax=Phalacrocorax aristotelis TaxID=126867 RepID=UPI003F4BB897
MEGLKRHTMGNGEERCLPRGAGRDLSLRGQRGGDGHARVGMAKQRGMGWNRGWRGVEGSARGGQRSTLREAGSGSLCTAQRSGAAPSTPPHQQGLEPCQEDPWELQQPPAAPGNGVVLPPSWLPRVPAPPHRPLGKEGTPGEMSFNLEKHLHTAFREKLRLHRTVPAWDAAALLPSTRLLLKRREVAEVDQVLQSQREEFQHRMERLEERRQQLGQRKDQLRDVILKFDAFLKASAVRQERALQRAGEERAWAAGQGAEAARLHQELTGLLQRRERLARRLRSLRSFGDYLRDVLARTGQESRWAHIQSTAAQKTLLLGQIKLAVLNLFQLATARLKVPTDVALEDTEAQLDMVLLCMQDLAAICAELRPRQPGPCPPRLPMATSTRPLRQGRARVPPSQE